MKITFFQLLILVIFFLLTIRPPVDLDLGWHLRYGEYFFKTGHVLKDNILSSVWPDYKWVQASWGYDLLVYQLFTNFGFFALSLAGAIFTLATFILITHPIKRFHPFLLLFLAAIFLTQSLLMYATGLRSQTPSAFLFALVLVITYKTKAYYCLPLLFIIWANMHGGFALGLILLTIIWLITGLLIFIKKIGHFNGWLFFGGFLALSYLTPLINPWGIRIYEETFKHSSNLNLTTISEWEPLYLALPETVIAALIFLITMCVGILSKRRLVNIPYLLALLLISYLSFTAVRFTIIFGVMATYLLAQNLPEINFKKSLHWFLGFGLNLILVTLIFADIFFFNRYLVPPTAQLVNFSWSAYCNSLLDCSENATAMMLKNPPKGIGYNTYNYGGYLSWRVPQVKTFVDGRMAAWEENGQTPPIILANQTVIATNPIPFIRLDSEYHFNWVIIPTPAATSNYLDSLVKTDSWKRLYQDNIFSYYVKADK